jgi:hypothetical protein
MPENFEHRKPQPLFKNLSAVANEQDLSQYVLSFSTSKRIDTSAGTFSVKLVPAEILSKQGSLDGKVTKDNWESFIYRSIRPMDNVIIGMNNQTIMYGFVDKVYKSRITNGQNVGRSIVIEGRDATKLFLEDSIANAPELSSNPEVLKILGEQATNFLGWTRGLINNDKDNIFADSYPAQAIFWILNNMPSAQIQNTVAGLQTSSGLFLTNLVNRKEDKLYDNTLAQYSGKILAYMSQCIDPSFYDLWIDTVPKKYNTKGSDAPCLFLRPKPFDRDYEIDSEGNPISFDGLTPSKDQIRLREKSYWLKNSVPMLSEKITSWENLTCPVKGVITEINGKDILQFDVGVSDLDVMTMFKSVSVNDPVAATQAARYGGYFPLIDSEMIRLFGLRELQSNSRMIPPFKDYWTETAMDQIQSNPFTDTRKTISEGLFSDKFLTIKNLLPLPFGIKKSTSNKSEIEKQVIQKRDRIWRWSRYAHILESGIARVKGDFIFVGSKIHLPDEWSRGMVTNSNRERTPSKGMDYYVNGVQQSYQFGGQWTTTLAISNGQNEDEIGTYYVLRNFNKAANIKANAIFTAKYGQTR